jgi:hypothetical protein
MSFEQPVTAAEADLERLLAIEPSIEFRSRVRERVAVESMRRQLWPSRMMLARAAAVILVASGLLIPSPDVDRPSPPPAPSSIVNAVIPPGAIPLFVRPVPIPVERLTHNRAPAPRIAREPEVVWDAHGADAIARLVDLARKGTIVTAPKASDSTPLAVQPLSVAPIATDSLMLSTGSERSSS